MENKTREEKSVENARALWERILNQTKMVACSNAILGLKPVKSLFGEIYDFKLTSSGCENERRNGSRFCGPCSEKFKNDNK